jgi:hypothetical protein
MSTIEMTEGQIIELLENGTLDLGCCLVVNIDREVNEHVPG